MCGEREERRGVSVVERLCWRSDRSQIGENDSDEGIGKVTVFL